MIERPFSIAPDPQYLYMSTRHKEAMAHLSYGLLQGGCFIVLTGEVGTGKTTLCRDLLEDLPQNVDVALILNANINESELLQTVCDELKIECHHSDSQKQLLDKINNHLLATFADNRHTVLIIDEAQLLSRDVLEQIRLLTNLETTKSKLLQIILIGQPELNDVLRRNDLRQLAQRVTARYHLGALDRSEIEDYVNFRLTVAGCEQPLFSRQALNKIHTVSGGIPRRINVLADHALLATYAKGQKMVDAKTIKSASKEVFIDSEASKSNLRRNYWWLIGALLVLINVGFWLYAERETAIDVTDEAQIVSAETVIDDRGSATPSNSLSQSENLSPTAGLDQKKPDASIEYSADDQVDKLSAALLGEQFSSSNDPGSVKVSGEYLDDIPLAGEPLARSDTSPDLQLDVGDTEFSRKLETSADLTGRIAVFRELADQWGEVLPAQLLKPACEELEQLGLHCLTVESWEQMARYNRPTIMVLQHQQQLHRIIVKSIDGDDALVVVGDVETTVPLIELQNRWTQRGVIFWKPGLMGRNFYKLGDIGEGVPRLRDYLNEALMKAKLPMLNSRELTEYDLDLSQKVFALQSGFEIAADGEVGDETHVLMNELIHYEDTPTLYDRVPPQ